MSRLERRRERMQANDASIKEARERYMAEHAPASSDEEVRGFVALRVKREKFQLVCECGAKSCTELIEADSEDHEAARQTPGRFLCEPTHLQPHLEQVASPRAAGNCLIAEALPSSGLVPEVETLKLHLNALVREIDGRMSDVNAALTRIATSATAGALVFGIFASLRPTAAESLATGWVIGALVPFLGLILTSLFGPDAIRSWIADQLDVSRRSFQDLREWRERRFRGIPTLHVDDIRERITAPGATYETFDLLDAAADAEHWNAAALLPQREWLIVEIQRQTRIHAAYKEAERKAERREGQVQLWLAALVVYIVLVTFLA